MIFSDVMDHSWFLLPLILRQEFLRVSDQQFLVFLPIFGNCFYGNSCLHVLGWVWRMHWIARNRLQSYVPSRYRSQLLLHRQLLYLTLCQCLWCSFSGLSCSIDCWPCYCSHSLCLCGQNWFLNMCRHHHRRSLLLHPLWNQLCLHHEWNSSHLMGYFRMHNCRNHLGDRHSVGSWRRQRLQSWRSSSRRTDNLRRHNPCLPLRPSNDGLEQKMKPHLISLTL